MEREGERGDEGERGKEREQRDTSGKEGEAKGRRRGGAFRFLADIRVPPSQFLPVRLAVPCVPALKFFFSHC